MDYAQIAETLNSRFGPLLLKQRIALIAKMLPDAVFPTNFGTEDQLISWAIINHGNELKIVTTLTGLLLENAQTLRTITAEHYDTHIAAVRSIPGDVWISGLRNEQVSAGRKVAFAQWDDDRGVLQINPLADWTFDRVIKSIAEHEIPINPLFDFGGASKQSVRPAQKPAASTPRVPA